MSQWKTVLAQGALAGSLASLLSTAMLAITGRCEAGNAAASINAVSHGYWGDEALRQQRANLSPTAADYLTHHLMAIFWASAHAALSRDKPAFRTTPGLLLGAAATSATAYWTAYQFTPQRFTPGFDHRLLAGALAGVYAAFAIGLAAGALVLRDQYRNEDEADEAPADEAPPVIRRVRAGHV